MEKAFFQSVFLRSPAASSLGSEKTCRLIAARPLQGFTRLRGAPFLSYQTVAQILMCIGRMISEVPEMRRQLPSKTKKEHPSLVRFSVLLILFTYIQTKSLQPAKMNTNPQYVGSHCNSTPHPTKSQCDQRVTL